MMKKKRSKEMLFLKIITLLLICLFAFSCTSVPEIITESKRITTDEIVHPAPTLPEDNNPDTPPALTEKIIFFDDFNDNKHEWNTINDPRTCYYLQNGYYFIENKDDIRAAFSTLPMELNYSGNFIIESTITNIGGKGECSYGITWGLDPQTNNTYFILIFKDYILYGKRENQKWQTLMNWQQSSFIKLNSENKIALKKTDKHFDIFVNEELIFSSDLFHNFGNNAGFILFGDIMISVDFLLISTYTIPDNKTLVGNIQKDFIVTPEHTYLFEEKEREQIE